jgi:hypothetical protein
MKTIISAVVVAISLTTAALAQQPAPTTAGPAEIFTRLPAGTTVTNFYKQSVYDPSLTTSCSASSVSSIGVS